MLNVLPISWIVMASLPLALAAESKSEKKWARVEHCDIPGHNMSGIKLPDPDACEAACRKKKDCAGFTYITGWNRCQLKRSAGRRFSVKMFAAKIVEKDGKRQAEPPLAAHDHKGKDMEAKPRQLGSAGACANTCVGTPACKGYVFIEGYAACWLKETDGALKPKQFVCGFPK